MSDHARGRKAARSRLILASGSPRRIALLAAAGVRVRAVASGIDERPPQRLTPLRLAQWAACAKAAAVASRFPRAAVIAADTVVALDGRAYGKPAGWADAGAMLRALSGRTHLVYTAVVVREGSRQAVGFSRTHVTMRRLSQRVIQAYLRTGEPQDKAGSYAIQGDGGRLVRSIRGPYDNVVGMPMHLVQRLLRECGIPIPPINAHGAQDERNKTPPSRASGKSLRRIDRPPADRAGARRLRRADQFTTDRDPELGRRGRA